MKIFAGVDGGGTRTRLALAREDGAVLGYAEGGPCSFIELGLERAGKELANIWAAAWRGAKAEPRPVDFLFMGLGSVLCDADAATNRDLAVHLGFAPASTICVENDAWNAHAGGLLGEPGILLIAGTGSACLGRDASGSSWRTGGWGHLLHDGGSAYALGHAALIAATRETDGRGYPTRLTKLVRTSLALGDMKEIFRKVHYEGVARSEIAALAPQVVGEAEAGDPVAQAIVRQNARELVEMVATVARKLDLKNPMLALTGGLITNASGFRKMFLDELAVVLPDFRLAPGGLPPVLGAVLLASQRMGSKPSPAFIQNLRAGGALAGVAA